MVSEVKQCTRCGEIKPLDQYRFKGQGQRRGYCHKCENKKNTERVKRNRVYSEAYLKQLEVKRTGLKTCIRCGITKEIDKFQRGKGNTCRQCWDKQSHQKATIKIAEHKLLVNELKRGGCILCGYNQYLPALDWHHIDKDTKDKDISSSETMRKSVDRIMNEISKCVVLCANCHRAYHAGLISEDQLRASIQIGGHTHNDEAFNNKKSNHPRGRGVPMGGIGYLA